MTITNSGQISMYDINNEFRYPYYQIGMYEARNGYYGGVRDASGRNPLISNRNGGAYYSGYALSDWYGFDNGASYPYVYCYLQENGVDVNMRFYFYNAYGATNLSEAWFFGSTGPWTDVGANWGAPMRAWDDCYVYWHWFGWGYYYESIFVAIYSTWYGYIYIPSCTPAGYDYGYRSTLHSGEVWYCYGVDDYC
jgi:hypothetical protein